MHYEKVILRCLIETQVVDSFVDVLLAYPKHDLKIVSYPIQTHHLNLQDIKEKVSGFKAQMAFEISLDKSEVDDVEAFLAEHVSSIFEKQRIPLLG